MNTQTKRVAALAVILTALFCAGFVFFYLRAQRVRDDPAAQLAAQSQDRPLPPANLIDKQNHRLDDSDLRTGKVVLVFASADCDKCREEGEFLRTVVSRRSDIKFYGVIWFGDQKSSLETAEKMFPFAVFYDAVPRLTTQLKIERVPIKVFVEGGVIKKVWGGATRGEEAKADFVRWLDSA